MKKLIAISLVCVLACSFMIGVFTSNAYAGPTTPPPSCDLVWPKYDAVCNLDTCLLYYPYSCPWGLELYWTGDYCCEP